jgi:hypothetical protein
MRLSLLQLAVFRLSIATPIIVGCTLFSVDATAQRNVPRSQTVNVSRWRTFANKSGWTIKYPPDWRVGSCRQCPDPTEPNVSVTFYNPATRELLIMIEHLADKPPIQTVEQWLNDVKAATVLDPIVREEWISLSGMRALKVINRPPESTKSENIYLVHGSKTFAIRAYPRRSSYPVYQRMLATFSLTGP